MEGWTSSDVLDAARAVGAAWAVPANTGVVENADYLVRCLPEHLISPTSGRVQAWVNSQRPFSEIRPEVEHLAMEWGADEVSWWVDVEVGPTIDQALRSSGANLTVTSLLLARTLDGVDADAWLVRRDPPGVTTTVVDDEASFRAVTDVETAG
jgi:hypothetical protein